MGRFNWVMLSVENLFECEMFLIKTIEKLNSKIHQNDSFQNGTKLYPRASSELRSIKSSKGKSRLRMQSGNWMWNNEQAFEDYCRVWSDSEGLWRIKWRMERLFLSWSCINECKANHGSWNVNPDFANSSAFHIFISFSTFPPFFCYQI